MAETLRADGDFVLSRRRGCLVLAAAADRAELARRLAHEYALRDLLDSAFAARPIALSDEAGLLALRLDDPGGELLAARAGAAWEASAFLRAAIGITEALRAVHARGLIHGDVRPANILLQSATGRAWLTGFGLASRAAREQGTPAGELPTTLAYIAPEQTGRMNRSVDTRSDLYALGATLYELLTGAPPFAAADTREWIHCHLARQPADPRERASAVPAALAAIALKLLAKSPEDRYQTAVGVKADLRACLTAWESSGRIEPFALGSEDISDRLVIPELLYGRERERVALRAAFERVAGNTPPALVLVSGAAGSGKSSLVEEVARARRSSGARLASGKFDQLKRDVPYATLAQALERLVRAALVERDTEHAAWRDLVQRAVEPYGALVTGLVPALGLVLGPQPAVPDAPADEAHHRFRGVLRRLVGALATRERPLLLFLDDLQWLDPATLVLVEDLVTDAELGHLLVVGAYRDEEVGEDAPLRRSRDSLRARGVEIVEVALAPLSPIEVGQLIADTTQCQVDEAMPLATIVHEKTAGNPLFVTQLVAALADEGAIAFDGAAAAWRWDLERIKTRGYAANVVELMLVKLHALSPATQAMLGDLGCLGAARSETLAATVGVAAAELHAALSPLVAAGLVVREDDVYSFSHDRVREAAYGLVAGDDRPARHLRIGRVLATSIVDDPTFDVVSQLNRGAALVTDAHEREQIAVLDLAAGKRAAATGAFESAGTYFGAGLAILGDDSPAQPRVRFELSLGLAECDYMAARPKAADERLASLAAHASSLRERAAIVRLRSSISTVLYQPEAVLSLGLEFLASAGVTLPRFPAAEDLDRARADLTARLENRPIEELVEISETTDPDMIAIMEVMIGMQPMASFVAQDLNELLVTRLVTLSLEHGHSGASCAGYESLACVLAARGDRQRALRVGQLGFDLMERRRFDPHEGKVCLSYSSYVAPWVRPLAHARAASDRTITASLRSGDLPFAIYGMCTRSQIELLAGAPLADVQRRTEDALAFMRSSGYAQFAEEQSIQLNYVLALRGALPRAGSLDGNGFEERTCEASLDQRPPYYAYAFWAMLVAVRNLAQNHSGAIEAAARAERILRTRVALTSQLSSLFVDHQLHAALAHARLAEKGGRERSVHRAALAAHAAEVASWAEVVPETYRPMSDLLQAELARIEGQASEAETKYERALRGARSANLTQIEAFAAEAAARCYRARGLDTAAGGYAAAARAAYSRWGAAGKQQQLDIEFPELRERRATTSRLIEQLDLDAVVKASQSMSSEVLVDALITRLMTIALEIAGAERAVLVRATADGSWIDSEATTSQGGITVRQVQRAATSADLPDAIVRYVIRAHEPVLLDDAATPNLFSDDVYLTSARPRSILCLPLVRQQQLAAVLYLENGLAPNVFTAGRVAVLTTLTPQAAVAIENARLYAEVDRARDHLRQVIDTIPALAWSSRTDGSASFANRRWAEYTGQTFEETIGRGWEQVFHPDDKQAVAGALSSMAMGAPVEFEARMRRADGTYRWFLSRAEPLRGQSGEILDWFGTNIDIDERKRAEAELEWRARLAEISASLASAPLDRLDDAIDAALDRVGALFQLDRISTMWIAKNGACTEGPCNWSRPGVARAVAPRASAEHVIETLRGGRAYCVPGPVSDLDRALHEEFAQAGICGVAILPLRIGGELIGAIAFTSLRSAEPATEHVAGLLQQVADLFAGAFARHDAARELGRSSAALDLAQRELAHVARVTSLGVLAASIAHEVNQPLSGIVTNASTCRRMLAANPPNLDGARQTAERMIRDANRAADVIARLRLMFSKKGSRSGVVDLNEATREVVALTLTELHRNRVVVTSELRADLSLVNGDRVQLQQVILNLVLNASDAMSSVEERPRQLLITTENESGARVRLSVRDAGVGFAPEVADRLFEAFYTSKTGGMGIGLSISRNIIENHQGRLLAALNDGPGVTFSFSIPALPKSVEF